MDFSASPLASIAPLLTCHRVLSVCFSVLSLPQSPFPVWYQRLHAVLPVPSHHADAGVLAQRQGPWAAAVLPDLQSAPMSSLRRLRLLACCTLAWFALSLSVATASPFVSPRAMELICSAAGDFKLVVLSDDGAQEQRGHTLDCPLCVHWSGAAPPPPAGLRLPALQPLAQALPPIAAAPITARSAAPLPARGPPIFS